MQTPTLNWAALGQEVINHTLALLDVHVCPFLIGPELFKNSQKIVSPLLAKLQVI